MLYARGWTMRCVVQPRPRRTIFTCPRCRRMHISLEMVAVSIRGRTRGHDANAGELHRFLKHQRCKIQSTVGKPLTYLHVGRALMHFMFEGGTCEVPVCWECLWHFYQTLSCETRFLPLKWLRFGLKTCGVKHWYNEMALSFHASLSLSRFWRGTVRHF